MKSLFILLMAPIAVNTALAQNKFIAFIRDKNTKEPLTGTIVNLHNASAGGAADVNGVIFIDNIPDGKQVMQFRSVGYKEFLDTLYFPLKNTDTITVFLETDVNELEEVAVSSTRSSRTIEDVATRIELVSGEELEEKANMKPGDIKMMLSESTGIQTLQTSPISGNTDIRIEGLDGRYTQILKDGFPLYAGFSGGLGLMQTPPLDLKRVEIIKGSSSTLYGGGSIAGLINLISKTPKNEKELRFIVNGTSAGGLDVSGFYGQRFGEIGVTVYAARNGNNAYAPDSTLFTAIPDFTRYTFNPKLFFYFSEKTELVIGLNTSFENRLGGDIFYLKGEHDSLHSYYEDNNSQRISSEIEFKHTFANSGKVTFKNSISHFNRIIKSPGYTFDGSQTSTFSEVNYFKKNTKSEWIFGANLFTDQFREIKLTNIPYRNYILSTIGAFAQNTWDISKHFVLESGLRVDYVLDYSTAILPRISVLYKPNKEFSSRLGGGLGYKTPTIFTEESERINYRNVLPAFEGKNILERSYGANWDINYKTFFANGKFTFSINQLFFYTKLTEPLVLTYIGSGLSQFQNLSSHIDAQGAETNVKIGHGHFKLFLGYTYTHSHIDDHGTYAETPLTPRHHTNSVLMYEVENKWKIGAEAYYYSPQKLIDGTTGRDYWLCGFMAERIWKNFSVYINFENILDSRQTRYGTIYTGSTSSPEFRDIYAPLDGFVVNGGLKIKL